MTTRIYPLLIILGLGASWATEALATEVVLTPMVSQRSGSTDFSSTIFCVASITVPCPDRGENQDGEAFGLIADFRWSADWALELLANRQSSGLELQIPNCPTCLYLPVPVQDFEITTFQVGIQRRWQMGNWAPFAAVGAGVTELRAPNRGYFSIDEQRASASLAAGVEWAFAQRLGLRLETRGYWLRLPAELAADDRTLLQTELGAGLSFRF